MFKIVHLLASQGSIYTVLRKGCYTFVPVDLTEVCNFTTKAKDTAKKIKAGVLINILVSGSSLSAARWDLFLDWI